MNTNSNESSCKTCRSNQGVSCDVSNCVYHDGTCTCIAEKINVGPSYATSSTDTICATFKQRTEA
ncbi:MAG: DUF1540 domain-containing protein [Clostridia bacterium]|nr:DUF1540 domain-containing protein [Clostridia bacterium]